MFRIHRIIAALAMTGAVGKRFPFPFFEQMAPKIRGNRYKPHQSAREKARRLRNIERGLENAALYVKPAEVA